jgi:DNA (cytosine-5)-methyltransferase 1
MAGHAPKFAVVDLFAGPGGLAEGFSAVLDARGNNPFQIQLSVEKDRAAHSTLLLRAFLRRFGSRFPSEYYTFLKKGIAEPDWQQLYPEQWKSANEDALLLELGLRETDVLLSSRIDRLRKQFGGNTVLIGGPPCQAYSLVGRARNKGIATYVAEEDPKHLLYENYIKILSRLRPAAFVMENVKGILSSTLNSEFIFKRISEDLRQAGDGYVLVALSRRGHRQAELIRSSPHPSDFIVCGEDFGLPQARHRVIIVGIRRHDFDASAVFEAGELLMPASRRVAVEDVFGGMPRLCSGLT